MVDKVNRELLLSDARAGPITGKQIGLLARPSGIYLSPSGPKTEISVQAHGRSNQHRSGNELD